MGLRAREKNEVKQAINRVSSHFGRRRGPCKPAGGEVMAPPLPLDAVVGAQGLYRDAKSGSLYLETWKTGDRVCCALMGGTVVILGRIGGTNWTIPER